MTSAVSAASAQVTVSRRTKRCAGTRPSGLAGLSIRVSPSKTCAVNLAPGGDPCRAHALPLERVAIRRPSARGRRHLLYPIRTYADGKGLEGELRRRIRGFPKDRPSPQSIQRWWYRQARHAGLLGPGVTSGLDMHQARHTFAMELRRCRFRRYSALSAHCAASLPSGDGGNRTHVRGRVKDSFYERSRGSGSRSSVAAPAGFRGASLLEESPRRKRPTARA